MRIGDRPANPKMVTERGVGDQEIKARPAGDRARSSLSSSQNIILFTNLISNP